MYNFSYRFVLPAAEPDTLYLKNRYYELRVHWDSLSAFQRSNLARIAATIQPFRYDVTILNPICAQFVSAN
jgi:hypothetical protein